MLDRVRSRESRELVPDVEVLAQLDVRARSLADSLHAGSAPALFKGRGLEPRTVRRYEFGDDSRAVDWRVTARRDWLHVRDFEEERDLEVLLVVDRSASLLRLETSRPAHAVQEIAAALAHVAHRAGHQVGLLSFTERPEVYVPPRRGRNQPVRVLRALLQPPSGTGTDLVEPLRVARRLLSARGLVVLISDFQVEPTGAVEAALVGLQNRHEVVPIVVRTPRPGEMPSLGPVRVRDPESGRLEWVQTGIAREGDAACTRFMDRFGDLRHIVVDPDRPLGPQLRVRFGARVRGTV